MSTHPACPGCGTPSPMTVGVPWAHKQGCATEGELIRRAGSREAYEAFASGGSRRQPTDTTEDRAMRGILR